MLALAELGGDPTGRLMVAAFRLDQKLDLMFARQWIY